MAKDKNKKDNVPDNLPDDKTQMVADKDVTMLTLTHVGFLPAGVRISVAPEDVKKYLSTGRARLLKEGE